MTSPNDDAWDAAVQLAQELSDTNNTVPLMSPDQKSLSLREAIAWILEKTTRRLNLQKRPVNPWIEDDLYGHILSLRAEQLQTQALLVALTQHLGLNPEDIITKAAAIYDPLKHS